MLMKTSFYGLVAVLLCSVFHPAMAQTPASTEQPPAPFEVPTDFEAAATPAADAIEGVFEATETEAKPDVITAETPIPDKSSNNKPSYYDVYGNPYNTWKYYEVQPDNVLIALQRDTELPAGHFILHMSVGKSFVSCTKILNPKYSVKFENEIMFVDIEKFAIDERDMPRYPHYECNTAPKEPMARVNLSKDQLKEHNVKQVKFRTDKTTVKYNVKMTDDYIQLIPDSRVPPDRNRFRPLDVDGVTNPLKFWFYPEGTVILSADGASKDITIESKLTELAQSKGLTPLDEVIPDHAHYRKKPDRFYFVDKEKRYTSSEDGLFDYIQTDAMKYGLEADEPIKKNLAVFIRKPGRYD